MSIYSATPPTIPAWLLSNSGKPSAEELNRLTAPRIDVAAANTTIPVVYGKCRLQAKPFFAMVNPQDGCLYAGFMICEGPIQGIDSVLVDNLDVTDAKGLLSHSGAAINQHLGLPNDVADPLLVQSIATLGGAAYTDTLPNVAYVVIKVPKGAVTGFPRVEVIVRGNRVYDPRKDSTNGGTGAHRLANSATWEYSDNPALCYAHFATEFAKWDLNWASVADTATFNDTPMSNGKKSRSVGLALETPAGPEDWTSAFRTYMGAFVAWEDGKLRLIPDRADVNPNAPGFAAAMASTNPADWRAFGVAYHFGPDDIQDDTLSLQHRSARQSPNSIIVEFTDASYSTQWKTDRVQYPPGNFANRRTSTVQLPGIQDRSQAWREAVERTNWFKNDLEGTLTVFDEGMVVQAGSIVAITHPIGLTARLFRVVNVSSDYGRWSLSLSEYNAAGYSTEVLPDLPPNETPKGFPTSVPDITGLTADEELFQYNTGITGSRVRGTWTADPSPFLVGYVVEGFIGTKRVFQTTTTTNEVVTAPTEELVAGVPVVYTLKVAAQYKELQGAFASKNTTIAGKTASPLDVPSGTQSRQTSDAVLLSWVEPAQNDIAGYEVRRFTGSSPNWNTATYIGRTKSMSLLTTGIPVGLNYYLVKAYDNVGNMSANARQIAVVGVLPGAPSNLTGGCVGGEVQLRWAPPASGGTYVRSYRVTSQRAGGEETTLDVVSTQGWDRFGLEIGQTTYRIYAIDDIGRQSTASANLVIDVTEHYMLSINRELAAEVQNRFNEDNRVLSEAGVAAQQMVNTAVDEVWATVETLQSQIGDLTNADAHDPTKAYGKNEMVQSGGKLYRSKQAVPANTPITNTTYWQDVGDYTSFSDWLAATAGQVTINTNDITVLGNSVTSLSGTVSQFDSRITNVETGVSQNATATSQLTTRVQNAEGSITSQGQAITALQTSVNDPTNGLASKASQSALSTLSGTVSSQGGTLTSQGNAITALQSVIKETSAELVRKGTFGDNSKGTWATGTTVATTTTHATESHVLRHTATALEGVVADAFPVTPGDVFDVSAEVRTQTSMTAGTTAFGLRFFNKSNAQVGSDLTAFSTGTNVAWIKKSGTVTAPANAVKAVPVLVGTSITGYAEYTRLHITRRSERVLALASSIDSMSSTVTQQGQDLTALSTRVTGVEASVSGSSPNMLLNPTFRDGGAGWALSGAQTFSNADSGTFAGFIGAVSGGLSIYQNVAASTQKRFVLSADLFKSNAAGTLRIEIQVLNASNAQIAAQTVSADAGAIGNWKRFSCSLVLPAGAANIVARGIAEATTADAYFRRFKLEQAENATPYTDERTLNGAASAVTLLQADVSILDGKVSQNASAITTVQQTQSGGGNLFDQSEFSGDGGTKWLTGSVTGSWTRNDTFLQEAVRVPPGMRALASLAPVGAALDTYLQTYQRVPCEANKSYIFSAYFLPYQCEIGLSIVFLDVNGVQTGPAFDTPVNLKPTDYNANGRLDGYKRIHIKGNAPANAVTIQCSYWQTKKTNTTGDAASWLLRPMLEEARSGQTMPSPWAPGATGASQAVASATQALTVANGAAQALTTVQSNLAGGGNLLLYSDMTGGQPFYNYSAGWGGVMPSKNLAGEPWRAEGTNNMGITVGGQPPGYQFYIWNQRIALVPGDKMIFSARMAAHRCHTYVELWFFDANGNEIAGSRAGPNTVSRATGGKALSGWERIITTGTAPAGAAFCWAVWITLAEADSPYAWICEPMLEKARPGQTVPSNYSPGSMGMSQAIFDMKAGVDASFNIQTNVNGKITGIRSNNNGATSSFEIMADNFVIVGSGNQRTEYSGGNWRVYDGNGTLRVRMGVW